MSVAAQSWSRFSVEEWHRLSTISLRHEPHMRSAYTQATVTKVRVNKEIIYDTIVPIVVETCSSTAEVYGLVFNPTSPIYTETVQKLTDAYADAISSSKAREEVRRILPPGLGLVERNERLKETFGLDARSALTIERMRQSGETALAIGQRRQQAFMIRGNMIATTETNRVVNQSVLTLWKDNYPEEVSKARRKKPRPKVVYIGTTRRAILRRPHKTWMTRRDEKVCKYCEPLDGITARLDAEFDTKYGVFETPPIHPRCRCFMQMGGF